MSRKLTPTVGKVYGKHRDRYLELVSLFPLRRIQTEEELDAATRVIDMLIDQPQRTKAEDDYLDVLSDLTMAYEQIHYPMGDASDADMLQSLIEDRRVTQSEAARGAGIAESTISEVLSGRRKLNRTQIGKLSRYFHVPPGVFEFGG